MRSVFVCRQSWRLRRGSTLGRPRASTLRVRAERGPKQQRWFGRVKVCCFLQQLLIHVGFLTKKCRHHFAPKDNLGLHGVAKTRGPCRLISVSALASLPSKQPLKAPKRTRRTNAFPHFAPHPSCLALCAEAPVLLPRHSPCAFSLTVCMHLPSHIHAQLPQPTHT